MSEGDARNTPAQTKEHAHIYTFLTRLCTERVHGRAGFLSDIYTAFGELIHGWLSEHGRSISDGSCALHGTELLRVVLRRSREWASITKWLLFAFEYLNRYTRDRLYAPSLDYVCMVAFRTNVMDRITVPLRDALLQQIEAERRGEVVEQGLIGPILEVFVSVGLDQSLGADTGVPGVHRDQSGSMGVPGGVAGGGVAGGPGGGAGIGFGATWTHGTGGGGSAAAPSTRAPQRKNLEFYRSAFEGPFLESTREFYSRESQEWASRDSCPEYMQKTEHRIQQEEMRVGPYLPAESRKDLMSVVEDVLLRQQQARLIHMENSGVESMLRHGRMEELARVYRLFLRIDVPDARAETGLGPIAEIFQSYAAKEGGELHAAEEASSDKGSGEEYIRRVVALHDRLMLFVVNCFANNHAFQKGLKMAFESFFNRSVHGSSTAELLATYFDSILRAGKGNKMDQGDAAAAGVDGGMASSSVTAMSIEADNDQRLDKLVRLFGFLSEKDKFSEFYRRLLAKRLLMGRSESEDTERTVISKLKFACGTTFTSKLEGMINDMNLSVASLGEFKEYCRLREAKGLATTGGVDMEVHVLQLNHWPIYKPEVVVLPDAFTSMIGLYEQFYLSKKASRKLQWVHSLGSVVLVGRFDKRYEVSMNTFAALICLAVDQGPESNVSLKDLERITGLTFEELKKTVASLCLSKVRLLRKSSPGSTITQNDTLSINHSFQDKMMRLKVPNVNTKLSSDEIKSTNANVTQERIYLLDAAIVRTMKARQVLSHNRLVTEVVESLRRFFAPQMPLIKNRIEDLIKREFLSRDEKDRSVYRYMA